MISVKMADVHFNVNEEKRTVIAWADVNLEDKVNSELRKMEGIARKQKHGTLLWNFIYDIEFPYDICKPKYHAVGKAKCAPEDTFDVEKGKQLALTKMMDNIYVRWIEIWQDISEATEQLNDIIGEHCTSECKKVLNEIDRRSALINDMFE